MHVERILATADLIEDLPPDRFDMSVWTSRDGEDVKMLGIELETDCGTAGCIAGWACALYAPNCIASPNLAQTLLDLTREQADKLFYGRGCSLELNEIPPHLAAATLRSLAQTGEVRWR